MALLNEEQIKQLVKMASVTSTARSYHEDLCEWNEKQQPAQFEPDWSNAPDYAVGAAISLAWVTESGNWGFGGNIARFDKPAPVITPHPHADLIAKFAEVAARRVDPWMEFEYKNSVSGNWEKTISTISFFHDAEYRYIGDDK